MPKQYPKEFRDDVIKVVLNRDTGVTIADVAKDFGIAPGTVEKWLTRYRVETGEKPGVTQSENAELRELRKQ